MGARQGKKPAWAIERDRRGPAPAQWLFGLHAVAAALANPNRVVRRAVVTKNAYDKLASVLGGREVEIADARRFPVALDPGSVHQGAALEVEPLRWPSLSELCAPRGEAPVVLLLDRVSDPHNVGAILRSAEVFGARAVVAPQRHAAPETGALAKAASGALERQPYVRVTNLATAMGALSEMGYRLIGLDGTAERSLSEALSAPGPLGLVLGAEGAGLRDLTRKSCHVLARIPAASDFASLNVSNAAAVALFAAQRRGAD